MFLFESPSILPNLLDNGRKQNNPLIINSRHAKILKKMSKLSTHSQHPLVSERNTHLSVIKRSVKNLESIFINSKKLEGYLT